MATRRTFIRNCSAFAALAAFVPASLLAAPQRRRGVSLADVSFGTFAAQVNSQFLLRNLNGDAQALQLVEAEPAPGGDSFAEDGGSEKFSLLFRGDPTRPLQQDTYRFEHTRIGRFDMFIVPIGCEDRSHCYYEAVFNRLPPESQPRGQFVARQHTK